MKKFSLVLCGLTILLMSFSLFGDSNQELIDKYGNLASYKDQDQIILYATLDLKYEADGSFSYTLHTLAKILSQKGLKSWNPTGVPYNKRFNEVEILAANIYHPDKTIEALPEANIKDQSLPQTQAMKIFEENFRKKVLTFSNVSVGDSVELKYRIKSLPLVKDNFCFLIPIQSAEPIKFFRITMDGPVQKPIHYLMKDGSALFKKEENNGRILYTWEKEDIAALKYEPGMVSLSEISTRLLVSTFNNWEELSRYGAQLNVGKMEPSPEIIAKVKELTNGLTDEKEKIKKLFNYVSQEIRYMGTSMDVGAFIEPHTVSFTFENKYGICRDKSILLISMLKLIGIKADDVIVNVSKAVDPEIPTIFFEHAIVAVYLNDGRTVYMDPTLELSTSLNEPYIGDNYVLHLTEEGSPLKKIPQVKPSDSLGKIVVQSQLDNQSVLKIKAEITSSGTYELTLRGLGKQLPGYSQAMLWQQLLQRSDSSAKLIKADASQAIDLSTPYKITLDAEIPDYLNRLGDVYMMKLPMAKLPLDLILGVQLYEWSRLPERLYPIFLLSPFQVVYETEILIPEQYELIAFPDSFTFSNNPFFLEMNVTSTGENTLKFTCNFMLEKEYISPQDYKVLKTLMKKFDKFARSMIILKGGQK